MAVFWIIAVFLVGSQAKCFNNEKYQSIVCSGMETTDKDFEAIVLENLEYKYVVLIETSVTNLLPLGFLQSVEIVRLDDNTELLCSSVEYVKQKRANIHFDYDLVCSHEPETETTAPTQKLSMDHQDILETILSSTQNDDLSSQRGYGNNFYTDAENAGFDTLETSQTSTVVGGVATLSMNTVTDRKDTVATTLETSTVVGGVVTLAMNTVTDRKRYQDRKMANEDDNAVTIPEVENLGGSFGSTHGNVENIGEGPFCEGGGCIVPLVNWLIGLSAGVGGLVLLALVICFLWIRRRPCMCISRDSYCNNMEMDRLDI